MYGRFCRTAKKSSRNNEVPYHRSGRKARLHSSGKKEKEATKQTKL